LQRNGPGGGGWHQMVRTVSTELPEGEHLVRRRKLAPDSAGKTEMTLDLADIKVRLGLHHFHNRWHSGKARLGVRHLGRVFPVEPSVCPAGAEIFGEIRSQIVDGEFIAMTSRGYGYAQTGKSS
jgi:hypothetical protein